MKSSGKSRPKGDRLMTGIKTQASPAKQAYKRLDIEREGRGSTPVVLPAARAAAVGAVVPATARLLGKAPRVGRPGGCCEQRRKPAPRQPRNAADRNTGRSGARPQRPLAHRHGAPQRARLLIRGRVRRRGRVAPRILRQQRLSCLQDRRRGELGPPLAFANASRSVAQQEPLARAPGSPQRRPHLRAEGGANAGPPRCVV